MSYGPSVLFLNSFYLYNNPGGKCNILSHIKDKCSEKLHNLLEVTQQMQDQDLNPGSLAPEPMLLTAKPACPVVLIYLMVEFLVVSKENGSHLKKEPEG